MTSLVTGATGFVGSAVVRALLDAGEVPRVLVRADSDRRNLEGLGVEDVTGLPWVEIDFPEDLEKAEAEVLPALLDLPSGPLRSAGA